MLDKDQRQITKAEGLMMAPYLSPVDYLDIVCSHSPVVCRTIEEYGDVLLADYLKELAPDVGPSFQQRGDLAKMVYRYAAPLLGESVARKASQDLTASPVDRP